jgi:5'-nucleotidase
VTEASAAGRPKILVTNDDGYASPGIVALADALNVLGEVTVVAPDHDNSGIGHQISIKHPVRVSEIPGRGVRTFRCSGTPADCVVIGAFDVCGGMPSLVVSGINRGANMGDDLNYSGTVAAATEGVVVGVPAMAISLAASWPEHSDEHHWDVAAQVGVRFAREILAGGLPRLTLLNVNVPNLPLEDIRGARWTRQGRKNYRDRVERRNDPRGNTYFWLWGAFDQADIVDGTDLAAIRDGYVSVSPITIDRTDHAELDRRFSIAQTFAAGPAT